MNRKLKRLAGALAGRVELQRFVTRIGFVSQPVDALSINVAVCGSGVAVIVDEPSRGRFRVSCIGTNSGGRRWLYDTLVTRSFLELTASGREMQVLARDVVTEDLESHVVSAISLIDSLRSQEERASFDLGRVAASYWSSGVLNVGDWCGPQLVQAISGRAPVQSNRVGSGPRVLYSVGSILGWIKRNNVDIWGSGLMRPLTPAEIKDRVKLQGIEVHAVRGWLTKERVEKDLGWNVPNVFGDPALLLPRYFPASPDRRDGVAVIAHNVHRDVFSKSVPDIVAGKASLIDVRADLRTVVEQVSKAKVVVSTSLHGLIFAQAYGVPWVWLDVTDRPLWGDGFKFDDFFSTLEGDEPARVTISLEDLPELDVAKVASKARLPRLATDLDALVEAFPLAPGSGPMDESLSPRIGLPGF